MLTADLLPLPVVRVRDAGDLDAALPLRVAPKVHDTPVIIADLLEKQSMLRERNQSFF